jgi:Fe2+ or Zn2+ uptake regulation protein
MNRSEQIEKTERKRFLLFSEYCIPILEYLLVPEYFDETNPEEITWSDIEYYLKCSDDSIYKTLEILKRAHYIRKLKKEKKKVYKLTFPGMVVILTLRQEHWEYIDQIANRHRELFPPVFPNWPLFREYGVTNLVTRSLQKAFEYGSSLCDSGWVHSRWKWFPEKYWPEYLKRSTVHGREAIKKLSEEEERELSREVTEDEVDLQRRVMLEFIRESLFNRLPSPREEDSETTHRLLEASMSQPDLRQLSLKGLESLELYRLKCTQNAEAMMAYLKGDIATFQTLESEAQETGRKSGEALEAFCKSYNQLIRSSNPD